MVLVHADLPRALDQLTQNDSGVRALRDRLHARAKPLGDVGDNTLSHGFARLVTTTAYEHWHRMLFARFLAERNLLLHDSGVPVSLDDCEELAREEGGTANKWVLAGRYASAMLPQIFRPDDPVLAVALPAVAQAPMVMSTRERSRTSLMRSASWAVVTDPSTSDTS